MINFREYLKENEKKELYVLYNKDTEIAPNYQNEFFKTWATSPQKAFHQILFRIRQAPDRFHWDIIRNRTSYIMIPWSQFQKLQEKKPHSEPPQTKQKENPQLDWGFGIDRRPPN